MQELEKIINELKQATIKEDAPIYCGDMEVDGYIRLSVVESIIRKHMNDDQCAECSRRKWHPKGFEDGKKNDGWIPVGERLPEDDEMMLVTCETKSGRRSVNRAWYGNGFWHGSGSMSGVIAWRPLPEPYRPEGSDNHDGE